MCAQGFTYLHVLHTKPYDMFPMCLNCGELHALYYCYSLTQPVWYSAGMMLGYRTR